MTNLRANKKVKYIALSLLFVALLFFISGFITDESLLFYFVFGFIMFTLLGLLLTQFVVKLKTSYVIFLSILLIHLVVGIIASLFYFPNLGLIVKGAAYVAAGVLFYTILLVNNVFVVIEEKGSLIPLYSVAVTWAQVLVIIISIPYFSGIYKIPTNLIVQNILILISVFLFCFYMIWSVSYDPNIKKTSIYEKISIAGILSFVTLLASVSVSFISAESFLRALFVSSVLMFDLAYIIGHYKNRLKKRMFIEYGAIAALFFILLVVFRP